MAKFGRFSIARKRGVNITRVIVKLVATILGLYVGGQIVRYVGEAINGTASAYYSGLNLIGWTVGWPRNGTDGNFSRTCTPVGDSGVSTTWQASNTTAPGTTCITEVTSGGVLAVVGIIGVASIILEFVKIRM